MSPARMCVCETRCVNSVNIHEASERIHYGELNEEKRSERARGGRGGKKFK